MECLYNLFSDMSKFRFLLIKFKIIDFIDRFVLEMIQMSFVFYAVVNLYYFPGLVFFKLSEWSLIPAP